MTMHDDDGDRPHLSTLVLTVDPERTGDHVLLHGPDATVVRLRLTTCGMVSAMYARHLRVLFVVAGRGTVSLLTPEGIVVVATVERPGSRRPRLRITAPRSVRIERVTAPTPAADGAP